MQPQNHSQYADDSDVQTYMAYWESLAPSPAREYYIRKYAELTARATWQYRRVPDAVYSAGAFYENKTYQRALALDKLAWDYRAQLNVFCDSAATRAYEALRREIGAMPDTAPARYMRRFAL